MKRPAFLALLLSAIVLLLPALVLAGCESLIETGVAATSLAESTTSTIASTTVPPGTLPEQTSSTAASGQAVSPGGTPAGVSPPSGTPTPKPTTTTTLYTVVTGLQVLPLTLNTTRYEEDDPHLVWSGLWSSSSHPLSSGGGTRYSNTGGSSVTIKFLGASFGLVAPVSEQFGLVKIALDGGSPVIVDTYSPTYEPQKTVWTSGPLAYGSHTVKIECTDLAGHAGPGFNRIFVDAFDVTGTLE